MEFKREAHRQARVVAMSNHESDDQDFIEQISEDWPDTPTQKRPCPA
ncbi:antitoxin MazE-like protein [Arthrobacter ulcerisalmonis]